MLTSRFLLAGLALLASAAAYAADVTLTTLSPTPRAWDVVQFRVDPARQYTNPFNPEEVAIDAVVTTPKGTQLRLPAFWYQVHTVETAEPRKPVKVQGGESFWMVRLCPTEAGQYALSVQVKDASGTRSSDPVRVAVDASAQTNPGFVRIAPNGRYFAFDSGQPYFLIGPNMGWGTWGLWADQFDDWFRKLADNGGNFARIWMSEGRWKIEHPDTGLGRYDLASAAFYDDLFVAARQRGIYVMLTFLNHRELLEKDMWGQAPWPTHVYNAAKGGPATRPVDFFTHPDARKGFRNRLRYLVARYSAYTSVGFWELFNEQEFAGQGPQVEWNREMSQYLADLDPYRRLVTTSCQNLPAELWNLPTMACTQLHYYGDDSTVDLVTPVVNESLRLQKLASKPQLVAEVGISYKRSDIAFDEAGVGTSLHNSLWTAMMAGSAGGAAHWWWDSYIDPKNLWHVYQPFARFARDVNWASSDFRPLPGITAQYLPTGPDTLADARLDCSIDWQKSHGQPITLLPNGKADRPLPRFLFSIAKPELRAPFTFNVDLAQPSEMVLRVAGVADFGMVRVSIDGKATRDFPFSALPGAADIVETKPHNGTGPFIAAISAERRMPIPAGKHTITLDNVAGDWVKLESITFTNATSAQYTHITALGVQDAATATTLLWVLDERSNWKNDKEGKTPIAHPGAQVTIPVPQPGRYRITWYDTRKGQEVAGDAIEVTGPTIQVKAPPFTRDIAARLARQ